MVRKHPPKSGELSNERYDLCRKQGVCIETQFHRQVSRQGRSLAWPYEQDAGRDDFEQNQQVGFRCAEVASQQVGGGSSLAKRDQASRAAQAGSRIQGKFFLAGGEMRQEKAGDMGRPHSGRRKAEKSRSSGDDAAWRSNAPRGPAGPRGQNYCSPSQTMVTSKVVSPKR